MIEFTPSTVSSVLATLLTVCLLGWGVTWRRLAESTDANEAAQSRLQALFKANLSLVYDLDADGRFLQMNTAAAAIFGAESNEEIGARFPDFIIEEQREEARALLIRSLQGKTEECELTIVAPGGARKRIRAITIPVVGKRGRREILGLALDVTEETDAKQELEVQRHYFEELFEGLPEAIAIVDREGRVRRVNEEFTRLFGYSRAEVGEKILIDLIGTNEESKESAKRMSAIAARGRLITADVVRQRKDGTHVEVSMLARRVQVPGQEPHVYAIYRDVSVLVRTERSLRQREEELRRAQRLEAIGKLAGGVAHEFNNLLTVINGHARFVLEQIISDDHLRGDLEQIEGAGARAATLTHQLLAFSRQQALQLSALELNEVVADMQPLVDRLLGSHITLSFEPDETVPLISADRGCVEQVVMNLLVNSRDAMLDGGTITIGTSVELLESGDPRTDLWQLKPGRFVRLRVEDTGIGMSPETLARAFDPFFSTKDRLKGTGLGLSTVFGIAKQTGGHVEAKSEVGSGTEVSVYFPEAREAVSVGPSLPHPPAEAPLQLSHEGATVLVVEDEPGVRSLVVRLLRRAGYRVLEAPNGTVALEMIHDYRDRIDLVVSDLIMPEMGGRELASKIRVARPSTRILMMSGYDEGFAAGELQGEDFLSKPFTLSELTERVAAAIGR